VGRVIPGWTEALQKMHVGDRWELYVPTNLAYNDNPPPRSGIQPGEMLIFQIELVGIVER
jgi:FKBP-type peptidyl-prolyl cis-trans isomerase FklB